MFREPLDTLHAASCVLPHQESSFGGDLDPMLSFLDLYFVTK